MSSNINNFENWKSLNEAKLDKKANKSSKKQNRKANKRSNRKSTYLSDKGIEYALIKKKGDSDRWKETYVLKSKNKDSKIWDDNGKITSDVDTFIEDELFSGSTEGKYDEGSISMEKYKQGKNKDKVKFTVKLKTSEDEDKNKTEDSSKGTYSKITISKNSEGENRITLDDSDDALLELKELLRKSFVKHGVKLDDSTYGMTWLDDATLSKVDLKWIKGLRIGFGMKAGDFISQGLADEMVDQANLWEDANKATPDDDNTSEAVLFNFNSFIEVNEAFDVEAANAAMEEEKKEEKKEKKNNVKAEGESSDDSGVGESGLTDEQAVAYRTWANSKDKLKDKYGKTSEFDLDAQGTNNNFVKKSYTQAKSDYESGEGNDNMLKKVWATTGKPNAWRAEFEKITGLGSKQADLGENEYAMGYISRSGKNWAVHFASPRPASGTVKKGDSVNIKNAWTKDEEKAFNVADVWKDTNGDLGAIYLDVPGLNIELVKDEGGTLPVNRDYEDTGIIKVIGLASGGSELRQQMQTDFDLSKSISNKLVKFWTGSGRNSTFAPYKGTFNDDEDAALAGGYLPWLRTSGINDELAKMITPYYKKTMQGVIAKTKEEMTDAVANSVSWSLFDPSKVPNAEDEGLIALAKHEPLASTWVGSDWDQIGSMFSKMLGTSPQMEKFSISGGYFDF